MRKLTGQSKIQGQAAAFFDLDGTLIRGDSQDLEARYLIRDLIARRQWAPGFVRGLSLSLAAVSLCRLGMISLTRQNEIYVKTYHGRSRDELSGIGRRLYEGVIAFRFFQEMLDVIADHRRRGDLIVMVSATTRHLIAPVASRLKPDEIFCTDLEFAPDNRATGRPVSGGICAEERKAEIVRDFARERRVDLAASHGYSDHHSDISFLACTGHAHAVNPTPELARHARALGWDIRYLK